MLWDDTTDLAQTIDVIMQLMHRLMTRDNNLGPQQSALVKK